MARKRKICPFSTRMHAQKSRPRKPDFQSKRSEPRLTNMDFQHREDQQPFQCAVVLRIRRYMSHNQTEKCHGFLQYFQSGTDISSAAMEPSNVDAAAGCALQ